MSDPSIALNHPSLEQVWDSLAHLTDPEIPVVTLKEMGIISESACAITQQIKNRWLSDRVKVFSKANVLFGDPLGLTVARAPLSEARAIVQVWIQSPEHILGHHGGDQTLFSV